MNDITTYGQAGRISVAKDCLTTAAHARQRPIIKKSLTVQIHEQH